ncbi:hypothetical protein C0J52_27997 [Blattella germanica]|nr:hypothetical protein C0J52_27997 [Blattella germanica]
MLVYTIPGETGKTLREKIENNRSQESRTKLYSGCEQCITRCTLSNMSRGMHHNYIELEIEPSLLTK